MLVFARLYPGLFSAASFRSVLRASLQMAHAETELVEHSYVNSAVEKSQASGDERGGGARGASEEASLVSQSPKSADGENG